MNIRRKNFDFKSYLQNYSKGNTSNRSYTSFENRTERTSNQHTNRQGQLYNNSKANSFSNMNSHPDTFYSRNISNQHNSSYAPPPPTSYFPQNHPIPPQPSYSAGNPSFSQGSQSYYQPNFSFNQPSQTFQINQDYSNMEPLNSFRFPNRNNFEGSQLTENHSIRPNYLMNNKSKDEHKINERH